MRPLLFLLLSALAGAALAAPAPFYLWQSKASGQYTCAQLSPGEGWQKHSGPFRDAGCRTPQGDPVRSRLLP
ncbi:hypothetical protein [Pseudomonas sp. ML96]|uniref:hypothetical protein n=1 Tax=Pseudomonadaceae TaxID=135621 RepID=UPI0005B96C68|nr:hypothetical protein [Pseudomonas sp. ML96]